MADVTFGVKVPEEMKLELSELMKNTELSGKEFMGMLLNTYKLEDNKKKQGFYAQDIEELQRLLNRIQGIYLNLGQKTEFIIEERLEEGIRGIEEKNKEIGELNQKISILEETIKEKEMSLEESEKYMDEMNEKHLKVKDELEESKAQLKNNQLLYNKYELEISQLNKRIENYGRVELEIQERNDENQKLKVRNDEIASEMWFLQRDIEKLKEEIEHIRTKAKENEEKLIRTYELELKNNLLEQRVAFNEQLEELKEENFKIQQEYTKKIQEYLNLSSKHPKN